MARIWVSKVRDKRILRCSKKKIKNPTVPKVCSSKLGHIETLSSLHLELHTYPIQVDPRVPFHYFKRKKKEIW